MLRYFSAFLIIFIFGLFIMKSSKVNAEDAAASSSIDPDSIDWSSKDNAYWKSTLSPEVYEVTRNGGTEMPGSGKYYHFDEAGNYVCSSCGQILFSSKDKYDSGSGWPSFTAAVKDGAVKLRDDSSHGMKRTEVLCARCGAHLGHVFDDGPGPDGKRYCINSLSLKHEPTK